MSQKIDLLVADQSKHITFFWLERQWYTLQSTIGQLYKDGIFLAYTLEDRIRKLGVKVKGATCIPADTYEIDLFKSPHFKRIMPVVLDVKNFVGIEFHWGKDAADTEGCILVGDNYDPKVPDIITGSKNAFDTRVFPAMEQAKANGRILILTVNNGAGFEKVINQK